MLYPFAVRRRKIVATECWSQLTQHQEQEKKYGELDWRVDIQRFCVSGGSVIPSALKENHVVLMLVTFCSIEYCYSPLENWFLRSLYVPGVICSFSLLPWVWTVASYTVFLCSCWERSVASSLHRPGNSPFTTLQGKLKGYCPGEVKQRSFFNEDKVNPLDTYTFSLVAHTWKDWR